MAKTIRVLEGTAEQKEAYFEHAKRRAFKYHVSVGLLEMLRPIIRSLGRGQAKVHGASGWRLFRAQKRCIRRAIIGGVAVGRLQNRAEYAAIMGGQALAGLDLEALTKKYMGETDVAWRTAIMDKASAVDGKP